jgi:hypothetical protein
MCWYAEPLRKYIFMRLLRKVLWYGFLSIPLIALLMIVFWRPVTVFLLQDLPFMGVTFNKVKWDDADRCSSREECIEKEISCIRGPMYLSLKRNYLQVGKSEEEVVRLLGSGTVNRANSSCTDYDLGMCSGLGIDYDWLHICFDQDKKIQSVSHYQS